MRSRVGDVSLEVLVDRLLVELEPHGVARRHVVEGPGCRSTTAAGAVASSGRWNRSQQSAGPLGRLEAQQQLVGLGHAPLEPIGAVEQVVIEVVPFRLEGELVVQAGLEGRAELHVDALGAEAKALGIVLPEVAHRDRAGAVRRDQAAGDAALDGRFPAAGHPDELPVELLTHGRQVGG